MSEKKETVTDGATHTHLEITIDGGGSHTAMLVEGGAPHTHSIPSGKTIKKLTASMSGGKIFLDLSQ